MSETRAVTALCRQPCWLKLGQILDKNLINLYHVASSLKQPGSTFTDIHVVNFNWTNTLAELYSYVFFTLYSLWGNQRVIVECVTPVKANRWTYWWCVSTCRRSCWRWRSRTSWCNRNLDGQSTSSGPERQRAWVWGSVALISIWGKPRPLWNRSWAWPGLTEVVFFHQFRPAGWSLPAMRCSDRLSVWSAAGSCTLWGWWPRPGWRPGCCSAPVGQNKHTNIFVAEQLNMSSFPPSKWNCLQFLCRHEAPLFMDWWWHTDWPINTYHHNPIQKYQSSSIKY